MSEYFFLQAFENMLISAYMYFFIVVTRIIVSVTNNASIQYITWGLISSLSYINFIHLPFTPLYIRWVCCCNVQTFVTYNWNKICFCIDHSVTGIVRVWLWIQRFIFSTTESLQWNRYVCKSVWIQSRSRVFTSIICKPRSCYNQGML